VPGVRSGRPVTLVWIKRIWRCVHRQCEQQTWSEMHPAIAPRSSWTERARGQACRRVGRDGLSVASVARDFGVGWATVMAAVREHGARLLQRAQLGVSATAIGVDETAFTRATAMRPTVFATGVVDLDRGKLVDIVPGRSRKVLADWPSDRPAEWTAGIEVAALDPFRGYGAALSAGLPNAVRVLDPFHVVRLGLAAVDDVRRRVQQETYGHRGRRGDPTTGSASCIAGTTWQHQTPTPLRGRLPRLAGRATKCCEQILGLTSVWAAEPRRWYC
jgi:transposase